MKKTFNMYLAAWAILFVAFSAIAFVVVDKYTGSFWVGYGFISFAFVGQLFCAWTAFRQENLQKLFYNIPLISLSTTGMIATAVAGGLCMLIPQLPYWLGILACGLILVVTAIAVIKAKVAAETVAQIDNKIKTQTFFIKSLTVDADTLVARAGSEAVKAECKKVYEAVRYSDPMSNDALSGVESQISLRFAALENAVKADDAAAVAAIANEIAILLRDRNNKCKLLK